MKTIAEEPMNWQRVRVSQLRGINAPSLDPNAFVYHNKVTMRVIDEAQYRTLLEKWEAPVTVIEIIKKQDASPNAVEEVKT